MKLSYHNHVVHLPETKQKLIIIGFNVKEQKSDCELIMAIKSESFKIRENKKIFCIAIYPTIAINPNFITHLMILPIIITKLRVRKNKLILNRMYPLTFIEDEQLSKKKKAALPSLLSYESILSKRKCLLIPIWISTLSISILTVLSTMFNRNVKNDKETHYYFHNTKTCTREIGNICILPIYVEYYCTLDGSLKFTYSQIYSR